MKIRAMMTTTAIHKLGDISRGEPDLCIIDDEDEKNFIGQWAFGSACIGVKFPKLTTRELTEEEKVKYKDTHPMGCPCTLKEIL